MSTTTISDSTTASSALAASILGTPTATHLHTGYSYATCKEFVPYLESNALTTRTYFKTMNDSEHNNWLIFTNEMPRAPIGNTNH